MLVLILNPGVKARALTRQPLNPLLSTFGEIGVVSGNSRERAAFSHRPEIREIEE